MAVVAAPGSPRDDPDNIKFMMSSEWCDCFFLVGNPELIKPETIGVVFKNLLSQSIPLRAELLARQIKDKKAIIVTDTNPQTFKNLLRYVYGYDNTAILTFEELDDLLYLAEKYQVMGLKARVTARLMVLLSPDNICGLLNNPVCYTVLELNVTITEILQQETDQVLAHPQFLELSCDALVKVLQQDVMNVDEAEVWRAAVRWAKHHAQTDDGGALRRELERPARHIRVSTIDTEPLIKEVVTSGILTNDEVVMLCTAKGKEERQPGLVCFSNEVVCRKKPQFQPESELHFVKQSQIGECLLCNIVINTRKQSIEWLPLTCRRGCLKNCPGSSTLTALIIITGSSLSNNILYEPVTVEFSQQVGYDTEFTIPLVIGRQNIVLQPDSRYVLTVMMDDFVTMYYSKECSYYNNEHIHVWLWSFRGQIRSLTKSLRYRTVP